MISLTALYISISKITEFIKKYSENTVTGDISDTKHFRIVFCIAIIAVICHIRTGNDFGIDRICITKTDPDSSNIPYNTGFAILSEFIINTLCKKFSDCTARLTVFFNFTAASGTANWIISSGVPLRQPACGCGGF